MRRMITGIAALLLFLALLLGPSLVRYLSFYNPLGGDREAPPEYDPLANVPLPQQPTTTDFVDDPDVGEGLILLDRAHGNDFDVNDISFLDSRLAARGFEFVIYQGGDLRARLRAVNAMVVIAPLEPFDQDEINALSDFVANGGRLLLIGDPTTIAVRFEETDFSFDVFIDNDDIALNTLANEFDVTFNGDYVFNTLENESNFRNIILQGEGVSSNRLTRDLERLVLYGSHSLQLGPDARPLLTADDNTYSSRTDRAGGLVLAALSGDNRVLSIGDINFLTAPYFTTYDNPEFIARIADFLTDRDDREYGLTDFPFFFGAPVDLIYAGEPDLGPGAFDEVIGLQTAFAALNLDLSLADEPADGHDAFYVGLYNDSADVEELLDAADVKLVIDPPILTEEELAEAEEEADSADEEEEADMMRLLATPLGNIQMSGTALLLLIEEDGRQNLVVLASSNDGLEQAVNRLLQLSTLNASQVLGDCLVQGGLALCPTFLENEPVEAELVTGGVPEPVTVPDGGGGDYNDELGAFIQGPVSLNSPVDGELGEDEAHGWIFSGGPILLDVEVAGGSTLDAVLEIYDPENNLIASVDRTFTGDPERLTNVDVDAGAYTIVVRDYFNDGGTYTLTLTEGVGLTGGIFIFSDDTGIPQTTGFTGAAAIADLLDDFYDVTLWSASDDGLLPEGVLDGYSLVIWASGDYRREDIFSDDNWLVLTDYLDNGGYMMFTGATPPLLEPLDVTLISDVEVAAANPDLLFGLSVGDVFPLEDSYESAVLEPFDEDTEIFLVRGPGSDEAGTPAGLALNDEFSGARILLLAFPVTALPDDVEAIIILNAINWFGIEPN